MTIDTKYFERIGDDPIKLCIALENQVRMIRDFLAFPRAKPLSDRARATLESELESYQKRLDEFPA